MSAINLRHAIDTLREAVESDEAAQAAAHRMDDHQYFATLAARVARMRAACKVARDALERQAIVESQQ